MQRDHTSVKVDPLAGFSKSKSTRRLIFGFCSVAKLCTHAHVVCLSGALTETSGIQRSDAHGDLEQPGSLDHLPRRGYHLRKAIDGIAEALLLCLAARESDVRSQTQVETIEGSALVRPVRRTMSHRKKAVLPGLILMGVAAVRVAAIVRYISPIDGERTSKACLAPAVEGPGIRRSSGDVRGSHPPGLRPPAHRISSQLVALQFGQHACPRIPLYTLISPISPASGAPADPGPLAKARTRDPFS